MAYRLGDFLVEKEFVSADHLLIALERQEKSRTPLGQLAIEVGMVSAKDVLVILTEQRNSDNKAKFGDIAVNKGILEREDIEKLFKIQEEKAELLSSKNNKFVKFKWLDNDENSFFEIKIVVDELTKDVSLVITDFAEEDEIDEAKMLWESQISDLKQVLGSS